MSNSLGNGIAQLNTKRQRRVRTPLPSSHPVSSAPDDDQPPEAAEAAPEAPPVRAAVAEPPAAPGSRATVANAAPTAAPHGTSKVHRPQFDVNLTDPAAHMVSPTQLSIPASIVARFDKARSAAGSHTALVLDALRAQADSLPTLILGRRPKPSESDLFPFRAAPSPGAPETPLPLRIRPTKGELDIMQKLVDWANYCIAQQRPGAKPTNRSEMVAAALDKHLPPTK
ncbi:MAG: hypothetical protein QG597_2282 [Actinomycetota bacterium]|nr:hypothetical protein [Actinomycetota bacterium]